MIFKLFLFICIGQAYVYSMPLTEETTVAAISTTTTTTTTKTTTSQPTEEDEINKLEEICQARIKNLCYSAQRVKELKQKLEKQLQNIKTKYDEDITRCLSQHLLKSATDNSAATYQKYLDDSEKIMKDYEDGNREAHKDYKTQYEKLIIELKFG